jgi:integrase
MNGDDDRRARQASANRTWTVLRAALNLAYRDDESLVVSDKAWRAVKPFRGVDRARQRYLSIEESKRLMNACDPAFRPLVQAALLTGARYGQLAHLRVSDFNPDAGTIGTKTRKGDGSYKSYSIVLSDEGIEYFRALTAGRPRGELVISGPSGPSEGEGRTRSTTAWKKNDQTRPMELACERARISPGIGINTLRHTWASHSVMRGVPLMIVAKNLGHSDTRMVEKHYGHLAPSYITDAIRAGAPRFDIEPSNVKALR